MDAEGRMPQVRLILLCLNGLKSSSSPLCMCVGNAKLLLLTPTVVIVMLAHQKVSGIEVNFVFGSSFSAKYAKLEKIIIPIAKKSINKQSSL